MQALGTDAWVRDATLLSKLKPFAEDPAFRARWRAIKQQKKEALAAHIKQSTGYTVSAEPLYDIHVGGSREREGGVQCTRMQSLGVGQAGQDADTAS